MDDDGDDYDGHFVENDENVMAKFDEMISGSVFSHSILMEDWVMSEKSASDSCPGSQRQELVPRNLLTFSFVFLPRAK